MAELQVAIDVFGIEEALIIAESCSDAGANIFEAGTPLIKSEGIKVVTELKKRFPKKTIIADMKTMDTGYLETKLAAKAGADKVYILAIAHDKTIQSAIKAGQDLKIGICCDLINVKDPIKRAKELESFGIDQVVFHIGIDEQSNPEYPYPMLRKLCEEVDISVAAAGGLNDKKVPEVVKAGADIVIVGRFITGSDDPTHTTKLVLKALEG